MLTIKAHPAFPSTNSSCKHVLKEALSWAQMSSDWGMEEEGRSNKTAPTEVQPVRTNGSCS